MSKVVAGHMALSQIRRLGPGDREARGQGANYRPRRFGNHGREHLDNGCQRSPSEKAEQGIDAHHECAGIVSPYRVEPRRLGCIAISPSSMSTVLHFGKGVSEVNAVGAKDLPGLPILVVGDPESGGALDLVRHESELMRPAPVSIPPWAYVPDISHAVAEFRRSGSCGCVLDHIENPVATAF